MALSAQVSNAFLSLIDAFLRPLQTGSATTVTATTSSASPNLTAVGDLTGVEIGATVTGTNIPSTPPTTVLSIDNGAHTAILSANATGAGTEMLKFTNPGLAIGPEMGLYTNNFTPTKDTLTTDFVEPTYPGYARQDMTVNPVKIDAIGNYIEDYNSVHFQPTATWVSPVPIIGYFVTFEVGGSASWMYAEAFANPVNLVLATDALDVLFDGYVQNAKVWGGYCATC